MASGILRKKLPPNMRSDFWNDFIDAIEEESEYTKQNIADKKTYFDMDTMSYARMQELISLLGFPLDVSINSSEDFLRQEIKSIPFKIKWKATTLLYLSLFKALSRTGIIYLYYYDSANLVRDTEGLLTYINNTTDLSKPYYHCSTMNFSEIIAENFKLDSGLKLDEGWNLDNQSSKLNTKHLSLELFLDQVILDNEKEYLITPPYFSYILTNMQKFKKVTEVIHVGCQLGAITDSSHYYNSHGLAYTMPDLHLNCVTTGDLTGISSVSEIVSMSFGVGTKTNLPSIGGSGVIPTGLTSKVAKIKILSSEKYEDTNYYGVNAEYIGNLINDETIGTGDGSTTHFSSTLVYSPVKPFNVVLSFISDSVEYTVEDNGYGLLIGNNASGTINYTTGEVVLDTEFYYQTTEVMGSGDGSTLIFNYTTLFPNIETNSVQIRYIISGTTYVALDNGSGAISGVAVSGTINYTTGVVSLTFTQAPASGTNITFKYSYQKTTVPDSGTTINVEYYFINSQIEITEAGLLDAGNHLLAYATFPPVKFNDFNNHMNMFFILYKSAWAETNFDGGNSATTSFVSTIDGGDASTTEFANSIDGGNSR